MASLEDRARSVLGWKGSSSRDRAEAQEAQELYESRSLYQDVLRSSDIDDITRQEVLSILDPGVAGRISRSGITAAQSLFQRGRAAQEPVFQSRRFLQEKLKLMRERPGRDQVVLSRRTPAENAANNIILSGAITGR